MNNKSRRTTIGELAALLFWVAVWNSGCSPTRVVPVPHLYRYQHEDVEGFLKRLGAVEATYDDVRRNASGTSLYIYQDSQAVVAGIDGSVKRLPSPGRMAFLDHQDEWIAWTQRSPNPTVHFRSGYTRPRPVLREGLYGAFDVDPSGRYYFIELTLNMTSVGSTANPEAVLASSRFTGERLFAEGELIYLFGEDRDSGVQEVLCHVFRVSRGQATLEREVRIPRPHALSSPFGAVDLDFESGNVLLADSIDPPFTGSYLLFNMESKKLVNIGPLTAYGFFLKGDILRRLDSRGRGPGSQAPR